MLLPASLEPFRDVYPYAIHTACHNGGPQIPCYYQLRFSTDPDEATAAKQLPGVSAEVLAAQKG